MNIMLVLLVLTLATGARSEACDASAGLVPNLDSKATKCSGDQSSCTTTACCKVGPTCEDLMRHGGDCNTAEVPDSAKGDASASVYATECCKAEADAKTCGELEQISTNVCTSQVTHFLETEANFLKAATSTNFKENCCVANLCSYLSTNSCPSGKHYLQDTAHEWTSANDFNDNCCGPNDKCGTDFSCPGGYEDKTDKATLVCTVNGECSTTDCCQKKPDTCLAGESSGGSCMSGFYMPTTLYGSVLTSASNFPNVCCIEADTCASLGALGGVDNSCPTGTLNSDDTTRQTGVHSGTSGDKNFVDMCCKGDCASLASTQTCPSGTYNIEGTTEANAATFTDACCKPKATCDDIWTSETLLRAMPTFAVAAATGIVAALLF